MVERLAIIDHATHILYIEDVDEDKLALFYGGEEEQYIEANYHFEYGYSWDYIVDAQYIPSEGNADPISLQIDEWIKD